MIARYHKTADDQQGCPSKRVLTVNQFLFEATLDNINLFKLLRYLRDSGIMHKMNGYVDKHAINSTDAELDARTIEMVLQSGMVLQPLEDMLAALTNPDSDGRILLVSDARSIGNSQLRFMLLNPANHFNDITERAHAVIFVGGTMQPVSQMSQQLFPHVAPQSIRTISCGHVIPDSNLLMLPLAVGPSNAVLDFSFDKRSEQRVIEELGRCLLNLSNVVPDGDLHMACCVWPLHGRLCEKCMCPACMSQCPHTWMFPFVGH